MPGGYSPQVKTEKSSNAKICLNFNFRGGGGILHKSKLKSEKSSNAKICLNFNLGGGGGYSPQVKTEKSSMPRSA